MTPWILKQTWNKLLFAHWPVKAVALRALIPPGLTLDTFDGEAWVGIVPFFMSGVRFRFLPAIPTTDRFCELNVRTYVTLPNGKPGVWFFSLDAASRLTVIGARVAFHLPYYDARMSLALKGERVTYQSERVQRGAPNAAFEGSYRPIDLPYRSTPGTLDHWLTERYCLYAADGRGRVYRGDIQHKPWPLQPAEAEITRNTMAQAAGISLPDTPPLLHYAERLEVKTWGLERV